MANCWKMNFLLTEFTISKQANPIRDPVIQKGQLSSCVKVIEFLHDFFTKTLFLTSFALGCTASLVVEDQLRLPPFMKIIRF